MIGVMPVVRTWLLQRFMASSGEDAINCPPTIISTLPLALFYHENEIKLRQNLELVVTGHNAVSRDGVLAVGYTISQSLKEKLNAATLIPQIITFLGEPQTQTAQHLLQVQRLLEQGASLERAVTELSREQLSTPIALAFYCFLSTLEDFRLSVVRAIQTSYQPQVTTAIAAALSGAYNTISGIPINWQLALSRDAKLATSGITEADLQIFDSLVAVWSGVFNQATHLTNVTQVAVAAPRVIRSR
jgi:ADP-ribosylglycohydrolase